MIYQFKAGAWPVAGLLEYQGALQADINVQLDQAATARPGLTASAFEPKIEAKKEANRTGDSGIL